MGATPDVDRPVRRILQDIVGNLQDIIRLEVRLAKAELKQDATRVLRALGLAAVGVVFAIYAGGLLLLALVQGLSDRMPPWLAALAVGAGVGVVAAVCLAAGLQRMARLDLKGN
jgi:uncharacterized membrane protein YqjE